MELHNELIRNGCTPIELANGNVAYMAGAALVARTCATCGTIKWRADFNTSKSAYGGAMPRCKACNKFARKSLPKTNAIAPHNARAAKLGLQADWTLPEYEDMRRHFGNCCALTGDAENVTIDHLVSISTGHGGTTAGNMMPLRADLNSSKQCANIYEWFAENKERFNLSQERFDAAMNYMAGLNGLSPEEYREYVYECHEKQAEAI